MRVSKRQKAYLDAMGIGVWSLREQPQAVVDKVDELPVDADIDARTEVVADVPTDKPEQTPDVSAVETPPDTPGLKLGPGGGGVLLVCAEDVDSASKLANDIGRALGEVPVWAWPDTRQGAVQLTDAVAEHLFTTVAIFGDELVQRFFEDELPANVHGANLVQLPAMRDIADQAGARRTLWAALCRTGMVSSPCIAPADSGSKGR